MPRLLICFQNAHTFLRSSKQNNEQGHINALFAGRAGEDWHCLYLECCDTERVLCGKILNQLFSFVSGYMTVSDKVPKHCFGCLPNVLCLPFLMCFLLYCGRQSMSRRADLGVRLSTCRPDPSTLSREVGQLVRPLHAPVSSSVNGTIVGPTSKSGLED